MAQPTKPARATKPARPAKAAPPAKPGPSKAARAAKPAPPAKPSKPAKPAKPAKAPKVATPAPASKGAKPAAAKPTAAAKPSKPAKPATTAKAAKAAKPSKPAKPAPPAKPARLSPTDRLRRTAFASVYPHYVRKVTSKSRTQAELDEVITWLTGYDAATLRARIAEGCDFESFYAEAPAWNPASSKITGAVCGVRVEMIEDPFMLRVRQLDKLVDELAKGRPMEKILRA